MKQESKRERPSSRAWSGVWPAGGGLVRTSLLLVLAGLVMVTLGYQYKPVWLVDAGRPGDIAYLEGFNGDERIADYSYRWTTGESSIILPGAADGAARRVSIRLSGWRPQGQQLPRVRVFHGGDEVAAFEASRDMQTYDFSIGGSSSLDGDVELRLKVDTFTPPGDARQLGVMVDWLKAEPARGGIGPLSLPPLTVMGLVAMAILLLGALLWSTGTGPRLLLPAVASFELLLGAGLAVQRLRVTPLLGWLCLALGACLVAANVPRLGRVFPGLLAGPGSRRTAAYGMAGFLVALVAFEAILVANMDFIGHADYADSAVVARNVIQGRGLTVDYVAQFYTPYPEEIRHPADTWPLLQPLLIVPSFAVFGAGVVAAKLPNLVLSIALALSIYWVGARLFDRRAGLAAAVLTAIHPYFVGMVAYPINDLPFTLLFLLYAATLFLSVEGAGNRGVGESPPAGFLERRLGWRWGGTPSFAVAGAWAGLLIWAKPTGGLLIAATAALCLVWLWRRRGPARSITRLLVAAAVALVVLSPWFARNLLEFGAPFYSTESYDAWILKYNPPWENIYNIYYGSLPSPILLAQYGFDWVTYVIGQEFNRLARDFVDGISFSYLAFSLALLGAFALSSRQRRLLGLLALNFAVLAVFVCVYWHYEDRYFLLFVPWLYLLGMNFVFWLQDKMATRLPGEQGMGWMSGLIVPAVFLVLAWPSANQLREDFTVYTSRTAIVAASEWLAAETPEDAVVMTRNPWEVSFHSKRRSVMIPNAEFGKISDIAGRYGATYLQLDHLNDWRMRPALKDLYQGKEVRGFTKVYESLGIIIYRFPD